MVTSLMLTESTNMVSMELRKPHYSLIDIQNQMTNVKSLRLTFSSRKGLLELDFNEYDAMNAIQGLKNIDFYKSMTTHKNHSVWQDVYKTTYKYVDLYIKFQMDNNGYFVISFKEL